MVSVPADYRPPVVSVMEKSPRRKGADAARANKIGAFEGRPSQDEGKENRFQAWRSRL